MSEVQLKMNVSKVLTQLSRKVLGQAHDALATVSGVNPKLLVAFKKVDEALWMLDELMQEEDQKAESRGKA